MKQGMSLNIKSFMNLKKIYMVLMLLMMAASPVAYGQEEETTPNTLEEQFRTLKETSNTYQEYKVVRETSLNQFYNNVRDSINTFKQELQEAQNQINEQQQEIEQLKEEVAKWQEAVEQSEYEIAHTQFLGIDIEKETYNLLVWGIILVLLIILAVAIMKYKSSNKVAVKKRNEYESLDQEFNEFKTRSREKETRLMRDLQTERNTVEELSQRLASSQKSK